MQSTNAIFLVQPSSFEFNKETAISNTFQQQIKGLSIEEIKRKALAEFNSLTDKLIDNGVKVHVFKDTSKPLKPDAIFPNNWISVHASGELIIYPMCNENRRTEKRTAIINYINEHYLITSVIDLSNYEEKEAFLEGTGSIVFDHINRKAYAALSPRTNKKLVIELANKLKYQAIYFHSYDKEDYLIYHTNVMMNIGNGFAVICLESITDVEEKKMVIANLLESKLEIIEISMEQLHHFAGNMLALQSTSGKLLVLSKNAFNCLSQNQIQHLKKYCKLLPVDVNTIETIGGGSVRCMITELFANKKTSQT